MAGKAVPNVLIGLKIVGIIPGKIQHKTTRIKILKAIICCLFHGLYSKVTLTGLILFKPCSKMKIAIMAIINPTGKLKFKYWI